LLHSLMLFALYTFLKKIELSSDVAFFATLLFAVHPGKAEGVHWVYGISTQLAAILIIRVRLKTNNRMKLQRKLM